MEAYAGPQQRAEDQALEDTRKAYAAVRDYQPRSIADWKRKIEFLEPYEDEEGAEYPNFAEILLKDAERLMGAA